MIYIITAEGMGLVKIGYTRSSGEKRLRELSTGCPVRLSLHSVFDGSLGRERLLHASFKDRRAHGEWFAVSPEEVLAANAVIGDDPSEERATRKTPRENYPISEEDKFKVCNMVTLRGAADIASMTEGAIRAAVLRGELKTVQTSCGRRKLIPALDVMKWADRHFRGG